MSGGAPKRPAPDERAHGLPTVPHRRATLDDPLAHMRGNHLPGRHDTVPDLWIETCAPFRRQQHKPAALAAEESDDRRVQTKAQPRTDIRQEGALLIRGLARPQDLDRVLNRAMQVAGGRARRLRREERERFQPRRGDVPPDDVG